jgi:CO/xanthine dehydrogenase Mo-binding subunit
MWWRSVEHSINGFAVGKAIFTATGKRIRRLPVRPADPA